MYVIHDKSNAFNTYYMVSDVTINLGTRGQALDDAPFKQAKYVQAYVIRHSHIFDDILNLTLFKRNVL